MGRFEVYDRTNLDSMDKKYRRPSPLLGNPEFKDRDKSCGFTMASGKKKKKKGTIFKRLKISLELKGDKNQTLRSKDRGPDTVDGKHNSKEKRTQENF